MLFKKHILTPRFTYFLRRNSQGHWDFILKGNTLGKPRVGLIFQQNLQYLLRLQSWCFTGAPQGLSSLFKYLLFLGVTWETPIKQIVTLAGYGLEFCSLNNQWLVFRLHRRFKEGSRFVKIPKHVKLYFLEPEDAFRRTQICLVSYSFYTLGLVVAWVRSLQKPEEYTGKGILLFSELFTRKTGKSKVASAAGGG